MKKWLTGIALLILILLAVGIGLALSRLFGLRVAATESNLVGAAKSRIR